MLTDDDLRAKLEWDPESYGVGIKMIDEQHRQLLNLINDLSAGFFSATYKRREYSRSRSGVFAMKKKAQLASIRNFDENLQRSQEPGSLAATVEELVAYAGTRLVAEDHMLETYTSPNKATQAADHELFTIEVCRLHKLMEECNAEDVDVRRLLTFLHLWIKDHIQKDRLCAPMLIERGVGA